MSLAPGGRVKSLGDGGARRERDDSSMLLKKKKRELKRRVNE